MATGSGTGAGPRDRRATRVVVADDAEGIRELMVLLLGMEPDFEVVGQARNGREAVERCRECRPDLVLLDLAMPVLDGLAALPLIRRVAPGARLVVFTAFLEPALVRQALEAGADAMLEKGSGVGMLVDRLRELVLTAPATSSG